MLGGNAPGGGGVRKGCRIEKNVPAENKKIRHTKKEGGDYLSHFKNFRGDPEGVLSIKGGSSPGCFLLVMELRQATSKKETC